MKHDTALTAEIEPQTAVRRVLANIGVVADELDPDAVEVTEQIGIQHNILANPLAKLFLADGQGPHQFVVQVDAQMRQHREQSRRRGVVEHQARIGGDTIASQLEFDLFGVANAEQQLVLRPTQLGEAAAGLPCGRRSRLGCLEAFGGSRQGRSGGREQGEEGQQGGQSTLHVRYSSGRAAGVRGK